MARHAVARGSSRLAAVAAALGTGAVVIGAGGVLAATLGAVRPIQGFAAFALGGLLGVVSVIVSGFALRATRAGTRRGGRGKAWLGLVLGGVMLGLVLRGASAGAGLPRINDITTRPDDPPAFEYGPRDPETRARDWSYPAGFAAQQRAAYPDLAPIALAVPPDRAFAAAQQAAQQLGLAVVLADPARGVLEARATSRLFRFVDDVAVRVRPADGGSVVDVRSKSRDGKGDLGANAERIRAFVRALGASSRE